MKYCCTRFNTDTLYHYKKHAEHYKRVYGTPNEITQQIPPFQKITVFEMDLDTNKINGIGIIKNNPIYRKYRIYPMKYERYNRFNYEVLYYINRKVLKRQLNLSLKQLEYLLFYGKGHFKRGQGITQISRKRLPEILEILNKCKLYRHCWNYLY